MERNRLRSACAPTTLVRCISPVLVVVLTGCSYSPSEFDPLAPPARPAFDALVNEAVFENGEFNTESYDRIVDNPFQRVIDHPLSTFSIDVDTASFANVRRFLNNGALPPADAVRIEELINYFSYDYPEPTGDRPFAVDVELSECPWNPGRRLARIGLKAREIEFEHRPSSNLVFLIDVSGSMRDYNKLPLLKRALGLLVETLGENDRVAVVVYAGAAGVVLESTSADRKRTIFSALDRMSAGGSTNGGEGIRLAYEIAENNFIEGGVNRVLLATDGDFNVGTTSRGALTRLIEQKAQSGVFLSILGFGAGNLKDATMEELTNKGNGNYAYIDSIDEARKTLVEQATGTLITVAKDVKIQIEFNPRQAAAYRLIGYENRMLRAEDFNDDAKDAGEIGAGHTVTALYEIVPAGAVVGEPPAVDSLKYQAPPKSTASDSDELLTVKLRYKQPESHRSEKFELPVTDPGLTLDGASPDLKFAAAAASFGMLLRDSPHKADATFSLALQLAEEGRGRDPHGRKAEFIQLIKEAQALQGRLGADR